MLGLSPIAIINTPVAIVLGMVYDYLPYMMLPIVNCVLAIPDDIVEASKDLGANRFHVFLKIMLPLSLSGIGSGITMVFVPSISTFYISQKLGGGLFDLIGDTIEREFQNKSTYTIGAAISLVMMILILISVAIMNRFSEGDENEGGIIV